MTTLAKLIELLQTQDDYESIVRTARFLQKALEILGHDVPESRLLDLSKKFSEKGIAITGDLSVLSCQSPNDKAQNSLNSSHLNIATV